MAWVVGDPLLCDPHPTDSLQHNSHAGVEEDARDQVYMPIPQLSHLDWLLPPPAFCSSAHGQVHVPYQEHCHLHRSVISGILVVDRRNLHHIHNSGAASASSFAYTSILLENSGLTNTSSCI